jgi:3-deoxy-manno-octulosonate cytidylyltransferase (CMP-KDO synthetase)
MSFVVVIPARYASTRLPGKPLADIHGKPMVQHVVEKALQSGADRVIVATDDERVQQALAPFAAAAGFEVCMTSPDHQSGTERLAEVCRHYGFAADTIIVNVQGDEPLIPPVIIRQVADNLAAASAPMATLSVPIRDAEEAFNPNAVKVVTDREGYALYFSRASIPWDRDRFAASDRVAGSREQIGDHYQRHIGIPDRHRQRRHGRAGRGQVVRHLADDDGGNEGLVPLHVDDDGVGGKAVVTAHLGQTLGAGLVIR